MPRVCLTNKGDTFPFHCHDCLIHLPGNIYRSLIEIGSFRAFVRAGTMARFVISRPRGRGGRKKSTANVAQPLVPRLELRKFRASCTLLRVIDHKLQVWQLNNLLGWKEKFVAAIDIVEFYTFHLMKINFATGSLQMFEYHPMMAKLYTCISHSYTVSLLSVGTEHGEKKVRLSRGHG